MSENEPAPPRSEAPDDPTAAPLGVRGDRAMSFVAGVVLGAIVGFIAAILVHAGPGLRLSLIAGAALLCGVLGAVMKERFWGRISGLFRWFK